MPTPEDIPVPEIDWSSHDNYNPPLVFCNCGFHYRSHHKTLYHTNPILHVSRKSCPGCGKQVNNMFRVSYDAEEQIIETPPVKGSDS
jgi:hypothetical protein